MSKEIYEDLLGPDAPAIFKQYAERHRALLSQQEVEAVSAYGSGSESLSEGQRATLAALLSDIADDFGARRRATMLRAQMEAQKAPGEEDEDGDGWIPDEDGRQRIKDDGDSMEAFLDTLDEK